MTIPIRQAVAVFCGSKHGSNPIYALDAATLAKELALGGLDIVYGGSKKGIMGDLANSALAHGAHVTGVIPEMLLAWEHEHESLTQLIITKDMHERKKTMYDMGIAGIVLPGGFGTLDGVRDAEVDVQAVGLVLVRSDLGQELVVRNPGTCRQPRLRLDPSPEQFGNARRRADALQVLGHIEIGLVEGERFYKWCELAKDGAYLARYLTVDGKPGPHEDQIGAQPPRLGRCHG